MIYHYKRTRKHAANMAAMQIHTTIQQANMFQTMFEELPVAIALTTSTGNILYANKQFSQLTGYETEHLKAQAIDRILHGDHGLKSSMGDEFAIHGKPSLDVDNRYLKKGENKVHLSLVINRCGQYLCFTVHKAINAEVSKSAANPQVSRSQNTDLVKKVESLTETNKELKRSNHDLSQYAYVASHDLQEPLRKIRIYGDMLQTSDKVGAKEKFLVTKMNAASNRMSILITDLLNYSKLLKPDDDTESVDLQEIIHNVVTDFEVAIQERKAVIKVGELPVIPAVRLQMNQLFFNLLGNALKFTAPGDTPRIEVAAIMISNDEAARHLKEIDPKRAYIHITFTDHGIGFNTSQAEEIFEVFKRLYTRDTYQGSGIGLALCRRIVQNHDGAVFATSTLGKGSVFNIVLPA